MNQAFSIIVNSVRVSPTQRRQTAGQRAGVTTVETSLVIAMILGGLLIGLGAMSDGMTEMFKPVNYALNWRERSADPVKQPKESARKPAVAEDQTSVQPDSNLLVGFAIPTAVLGVVAASAYLFVKW